MTTLSVPVRPSGLAAAGLGPVVAALLVWAIADPIAGVDLATSSGRVGLPAVLVVAALVTLTGLGLLTALRRRSARPVRLWTRIALGVLAVSLLGPLGADSVGAGIALAALHLVVGGTLVLGARRISRDR